ncbi:MAG: 2-dehydro-3-deoxygalactonokinase [Ferruginibacter sp.]
MKLFFSCDWGTSNFRLRLIDAGDLTVLSEIKTNHGMAAAFESWTQSGRGQEHRTSFYRKYLSEQIGNIDSSYADNIADIPIILSGMVSSSIGMVELPYKEIPFNCDGSDLDVHVIPKDEKHASEIMIISGARTEVDVARGEETMVAGCEIVKSDTEAVFIFPGTHSKHMLVKNGLVKNITTYMTGELFDLLSNKSILSGSVKKSAEPQNIDEAFFAKGIRQGILLSLTNSIFHVRTNHLLKKATPQQNHTFLSGLLIGHELKDLAAKKPANITLVCSEGLKNEYGQALKILGLHDRLQYKNADDALIKGQWRIIRQKGYV